MLLASSDTKQTLTHLFLFTNSAQRELVRKVYATPINIPCIITLHHTTFCSIKISLCHLQEHPLQTQKYLNPDFGKIIKCLKQTSLFRDELTQQRDGLQLDLADIKVKFEVKRKH